MTISAQKSEFTILGTETADEAAALAKQVTLVAGGGTLKYCATPKFLGVHLDPTVSGSEQVKAVKRKAGF